MKNIFKNALFRGTLILTFAALISRILGFFYRIYLTRMIGSNGIGILQLITPILGIIFALCCSGIQTGISKFAATTKRGTEWLLSGLLISLPLSLVCTFVVFTCSDFIADKILLNPECSVMLRLMAVAFPFSVLHNCINGYYYGKKCAGIPAFSQLLEQIVRIASVFLYGNYCTSHEIPVTVLCAIYGNIIGEIASFVFCAITMIVHKHYIFSLKDTILNTKIIFRFSLPLTFNRLLMHILQAGEAILIPAQLLAYGHSQNEALSLYGILTGMVLPLILFPCAITNSLSVMLLPEISHAQAASDTKSIIRTIHKSIYLCILMGIASTLLFVFYGAAIGAIIFDEPLVYNFSLVIAWLCPFVYLSTTLGSILNGLGHTTATCTHNILCLVVRITFLVALVPNRGITAYLLGLLFAQIFLCFAHYITISRMFKINFNPYDLILKPVLYCLLAVGMSLIPYEILSELNIVDACLTQVLCAGIAVILMLLLLYSSKRFTYKSKTNQ